MKSPLANFTLLDRILIVKKYKVVLRNLNNPLKTKIVTVVGEDTAQAMSAAEKEDWLAAGATEIGEAKSAFSFSVGSKIRDSKFSNPELVKFCKGLSVMLKAGISIVDALEFYSNSLPSKGLKKVLLDIQDSLKAGDPPQVAFGKTKAFDALFVGLVAAGAAAGDLSAALENMAHQMELQQTLKTKLRKIIILPTTVITLLAGIFLAAQLIVTPRIKDMLLSNRVQPDAFSAFVFKMSEITAVIWIPTVAVIVALTLTIIFNKSLRLMSISIAMSRLKTLRDVIMGVRQTTFIGTLSMLQNSGIVMEEALSVTAGAMSNNPMGKEIEEVRNQYLTGLDVSKCVRQFTSCEPTVVHMMAIGEQTGQLPEQLNLCASMLEDQTKNAMDALASRVQLLSTAIPVLLIAFIFISSYMPIVMMSAKMMQSFGD
jgi:type IV pilus assembly protein PilC